MTRLQSEAIDKIGAALLEAKKNFGPVLKDKTNPAFKSKYADLGAVLDAVEPALLGAGIVVLQPTYVDEADQRMVVRTMLLHAPSQQYLASEWKLNPAKQDPQGEGSALTYGRRYSVLTMLGIAPEDDDGNAARPAPPAAPPRDWLKELAACTTDQQVMNLGRECAAAGQWDKFEPQFRAQLDAMKEAAAPKDSAPTTP